MRLRRRKDKPDEGAEPVVRDAEGDPVEDPTVSGILPPLDAGVEPGEAVTPPPPPPSPEFAPEAPTAVEREPVPVPEPAAEVAGPEPAIPEPIPGPEAVSEPPAPEPEPVVAEPAPVSEPVPATPESVPAAPEAVSHELAEPEPAGVTAPASRSGRPELLVGAAFVGGVVVATVLRRLARR